MTPGLRFVAAVLRKKDAREWFRRGDAASMMSSPAEKALCEFVGDYLKNYGELPPLSAAAKAAGTTLPEVEEAPGFHWDRLKDRHIEDVLRAASVEASKHLTGVKDPHAALEAMKAAVIGLTLTAGAATVTDFRDAGERVMKAYLDKVKGISDGMELGWPSVDVHGGMTGGDLISLVGRPASGKSFKMLYFGQHAWKKHEAPILLATYEMAGAMMETRLAAMEAHVPLSPLKQGILMPKHHRDQLDDALAAIKDHPSPFYIADAKMAGTVDELFMMASALKVSAVYVDGAYLIQHPNKRLGRYERVAANCDLLKGMATTLHVPVVCSWQFNREAAKKQKKAGEGKVDLEDIGYTDAIGQHSSVVLGLMQDDDVDTMKQRRVTVIKGRGGEVGTFNVRWDFSKMDFSEVKDDPVEELGHI